MKKNENEINTISAFMDSLGGCCRRNEGEFSTHTRPNKADGSTHISQEGFLHLSAQNR